MPRPEPITIAGAGIIGLAIALELDNRGHAVTVYDRGLPLAECSTAAAGMLAADDPHNPAALSPLAHLSLTLYEPFLNRIRALSNLPIPYQTSITHQHEPTGTITLAEHSLDPRQLAAALTTALRKTRIDLRESTLLPTSIPGQVIHATGAWRPAHTSLPITPRKGQMLRVRITTGLSLTEVHRRADIYIVPRLHGPQAGTALIGATVEDAGFDKSTHPEALHDLRARAATIIPALASAEVLESWAGLRPHTPSLLPIIARLDARTLIATGHFRNGILLAPATALLIANLIDGHPSPIDLTPFEIPNIDHIP